MRILRVEDERGLGEAIREYISSEGDAVDWFETLSDASARLTTTAHYLIPSFYYSAQKISIRTVRDGECGIHKKALQRQGF
ncbi:hypothetical protein [Amphritea sp.]|uniref:hypothetical protein n=1 Tax=Amphritea sp. TaxID=1872502 RepID=UPI003568A2D7